MRRINPEFFLLINGFLVSIGFFFFVRYLKQRQKDYYFRDDLWVKQQKEKEIKPVVQRQKPHEKVQEPEAPRFQTPNFSGAPHQILGIKKTATREEIIEAHRHWIKRYHPDHVAHLGEEHIEQAKLRAEQLNWAKEEMLKSATTI